MRLISRKYLRMFSLKRKIRRSYKKKSVYVYQVMRFNVIYMRPLKLNMELRKFCTSFTRCLITYYSEEHFSSYLKPGSHLGNKHKHKKIPMWTCVKQAKNTKHSPLCPRIFFIFLCLFHVFEHSFLTKVALVLVCCNGFQSMNRFEIYTRLSLKRIYSSKQYFTRHVFVSIFFNLKGILPKYN